MIRPVEQKMDQESAAALALAAEMQKLEEAMGKRDQELHTGSTAWLDDFDRRHQAAPIHR